MKKIHSIILAGIMAFVGSVYGATVEAQTCKVRVLGDRQGFLFDQNLAIGIRRISGVPYLFVKPSKGQVTFPTLRAKFGDFVEQRPNVPLETYVQGDLSELPLPYDAKRKIYLLNIQEKLLAIARTPGRTGFIEAVQRVTLAGMNMDTPLTDVVQVTCRPPRGIAR